MYPNFGTCFLDFFIAGNVWKDCTKGESRKREEEICQETELPYLHGENRLFYSLPIQCYFLIVFKDWQIKFNTTGYLITFHLWTNEILSHSQWIFERIQSNGNKSFYFAFCFYYLWKDLTQLRSGHVLLT